MDIKSIVDLVSQGGAVALLIFFFVSGYKGFIIWGRELTREIERRQQVEKERDDWRELALKGTNLAQSLTEVTERRIFSGRDK
jgi:hypothetical protein